MRSRLRIDKLVVIGVGLIGGSFAAALKRARAVARVVGVGRTRANLATALRLGIVDEASRDPAGAVRDADLVLLAVPVGQMAAAMAAIAPALPSRAVVTDAGSTKCDVVANARRFLGTAFPRFVPAHPIAGTEKSGAAAASPALFRGRTVIVTPQPETAAEALSLVRRAWEACGARVRRLEAQEHDAILAAVSHLPHVVAFALVGMLARRRDPARLFGFSAGGLRDTVRIAGSSPEMWADICRANREALLAAIEDYEDELERVRGAIERGDAATLRRVFERARAARARWLVKAENGRRGAEAASHTKTGTRPPE
ncbi:MAG TPA: prephenate dehydrogenase/arogenate dehydrogenase family protein [Burkholderiales bacterium]|nr:prephenate dehydrogenase/arogenate dehydrogenase family protein [Burkholderiales bacterium]